MHRSIDYYFSLVSPWAYIGHATFMNLTQRHSLDVNFKPVSLPTIFAETGGLPLNKRAPARQRYRIMELQRWREKRGVRLNVHPKFWPFNVEAADHLTVAIVESGANPNLKSSKLQQQQLYKTYKFLAYTPSLLVCTLPLYPSEEALYQPAPHVTS